MAITISSVLCFFHMLSPAIALAIFPSHVRSIADADDGLAVSLLATGQAMEASKAESTATIVKESIAFQAWEIQGAPTSTTEDSYGGLYRNLMIVNGICICCALGFLAHSWGPRFSLGSQEGFLGMTQTSQVLIFFAYVSLACTHTFTQHKSGSTGYSLIAATALIYICKAVVAFGMYQVRGHGKISDVFKSADELGQPRFGRIPAIVLLSFPAVSLAFYDLLSFMTLAKMDPVTYQILRSGRIILVAGLWQPALGKVLSRMQMAALVFFMAASMSKGIDQVGGTGEFSLASLVATGIVLIMAQIIISVFANVASEVCLKQIPLHTDLINFAGYSTGLVALMGFLAWQQGPAALYEQAFAPAAWTALFGDLWMCASIATLVTFGIITAYFLRDLSNILKELSFGFVIIITAAVELATTNTTCTPLGASAIVLTVLAIMVYNADPLATTPKPEAASAKQSLTK